MKDFEIAITLPADARFAGMLRALAAQAALYAGCAPASSEAFAEEVDGAMRGCLHSVTPGTEIPVVVRCLAGEVEVLMTCDRAVRVARPVSIDA